PVLSAFGVGHCQDPVPQYNFTAGFKLFFNEIKYSDKRDEIREWLASRDLDINDPKLALGYIPLGKLKSGGKSKDEILRNLKEHLFCSSVSLNVNKKETMDVWLRPFHPTKKPWIGWKPG